jgi:hypothetical protein
LGEDVAGFFFSSDTNGGAVRFLTNNGSLHEWMRITSAGNVGIGTTTPLGASKLDVAGNINIPLTTSSTSGGITSGGIQFLHGCCASSGNVFAGPNAGNFTNTGVNNAAIGGLTLAALTTGNQNTASGYYALYRTTNGGNNTATGASTLLNNTSGSHNTANGYSALIANTTGSQNTAIGLYALNSNTVNGFNTAVGAPALMNSTGSSNTAIGAGSGGTVTTGSSDTFLGAGTDAGSGALIYATAVGAGAVVSQSYSLVLGGTGGSAVKVGIGTTTPAEPLHVASGDAYISTVGSGLILKSPDGLTCKKVTISNAGAMVLTTVTCP